MSLGKSGSSIFVTQMMNILEYIFVPTSNREQTEWTSSIAHSSECACWSGSRLQMVWPPENQAEILLLLLNPTRQYGHPWASCTTQEPRSSTNWREDCWSQHGVDTPFEVQSWMLQWAGCCWQKGVQGSYHCVVTCQGIVHSSCKGAEPRSWIKVLHESGSR